MGKVKKYEDVELLLQQGQGKEFPLEPNAVIKQNDEMPIPLNKDEVIIRLLKLIQEHLKAIERNTFKGY